MNLLGLLGSAGLFLGVALGAFGAHALRDQLSERMMAVFETGVRYQMYHSLAILLVFLIGAPQGGRLYIAAGFLYAAGIVLFSGSLYLLALTNIRWVGAITPLGGLCFLCGHALLFTAFLRMRLLP